MLKEINLICDTFEGETCRHSPEDNPAGQLPGIVAAEVPCHPVCHNAVHTVHAGARL